MPCWVAIAPLMGGTTGWRHTEFTGRHPKTIRSPHRAITSAKAVKRSIVSPRARSRWPFPCVASGSDRSKFGSARSNRSGTHSTVRPQLLLPSRPVSTDGRPRKLAASGRTGSERDQSHISGVRTSGGLRRDREISERNRRNYGEPPRNRTENPQIKSRIRRSK